jgi:hypothetical protein
LLQAFGDELSGEVEIGAVFERNGDLRQAVARDRTRVVEIGQAEQCGLDRVCQALLGLQRRIAGAFGVDLHLHVGDVGGRIDRQARVVPRAERGEAERDEHHEPAMSDREANNGFEHDRPLSGRGLRPTFRCRP